jgi:hypothetical protein
MIVFRQKDFSILSSTIAGAGLGASAGSLGTIIFKRKPKDKGEFYYYDKDKNGNDIRKFDQDKYKAVNNKYNLQLVGGGMLIGAALGALVGTIKEISKRVNRNKTVDARLMEKIQMGLTASGLKEGIDYTRDPKQANQMKTRVCLVISKYSGELKLLINVVKDKKLEQLTEHIVKNIPNTSNVVTRTGDRYNDVIVSTISDNSADPGLICGIVEEFVHNKYPVYLVEVG